MDDIVDQMFNVINSEPTNDIEILIAAEKPKDIIDVPAVVDKPIKQFDQSFNLINDEPRKTIKNEKVFTETEIFSSPITTTMTIGGFISNICFLEEELIKVIEPTPEIPIIKCNYGKKVYDGYIEHVKTKKTNRGRKKKEKVKKIRKKQGAGTDFNSQITFIAVSRIMKNKTYKFKVFRTGELQLPGAHPRLTDDIVYYSGVITDMLNKILHSGESEEKLSKPLFINPVMINYKFHIKMTDSIIDLGALENKLSEEKNKKLKKEEDEDTPEHPDIFFIKYNNSDSKLSIKFLTPTKKDTEKCVRINIFMRGKVNILGAIDIENTYIICEYLHWLFTKYHSNLIVSPGPKSLPELLDNITINIDEAAAIADEFIDWNISKVQLPPEPSVDYVIEYLLDKYKKIIESADEYLSTLVCSLD